MVDQQYRWIPAMRRTYDRRLSRYARQVEHSYPGVLDRIAELAPTIAGASPPWCPLPIGAVRALGVPAGHVSMVTAIAGWQMAGRHLAYIHPDRLPPAVDLVPLADLQSLPVRCVYLATSDADGQRPSGYFVWLEYDEAEDRSEVRMQVDLADSASLWQTLTDPVHAVRGTLRDAVSATQTTMMMRGSAVFGVPMPPVGKGTALDPLIDKKTVAQGNLLAAAAYLSSPQASVIDARAVLGEDGAQDWAAPRADSRELVLWLAS